MGTFIGVTVSNGVGIKEGKEEEVRNLIDRYKFLTEGEGSYPYGGLVCRIDHMGGIEIWRYEWPDFCLSPKNDEDFYYADCIEEFVKELAPFLSENLILHAVENEKCFFPLSAIEIKLTPLNRVVRVGALKWRYYYSGN